MDSTSSPPTLSTYNLAVMASPRLVHNRLLPREERMGCKGSYELVPRTYKTLGWLNKTSSQMGFRHPMLQQHLYFGDSSHEEHSSPESIPQTDTCHRYNSQGALRSHSGKTHSIARHRSCSVDSTLTTHPRRTLRSPQVVITLFPHYRHQVP